MNIKARCFPSTLAGLSALLMASQLYAQGGIEEIVVTARKAEESLQQTPVAVTALTGKMMIESQVVNISDLQRIAPNLSIGIGDSGPSTVVYVAIRGQAQTSPNSAADPSVGIYIDGVYYARPSAGNVDLLDVARAEVLRGPQGTLFGRNTTGGAINILTNQPTGEYEGSITVEAGNFDHRKVEAIANIPIDGEELGVRFAARYNQHDGYGRNETLNLPMMEVDKNFFGRANVLWAPADLPATLAISADYSDYEDSGQIVGTTAVNRDLDMGGISLGQIFDLAGFDPAPYIQSGRNYHKTYGEFANSGRKDLDTPRNLNESKGISATLDIDLDGIEFKSITAYRESDTRATMDLDGLPVGILTFSSIYEQEQVSQEFQLSGSFADSVDWITGVYYFREKSYEQSDSISFDIFNMPVFQDMGFPPQEISGGTRANFDNVSKGIFAQLNYHFTDRLRATAGYRYTWDSREIVRKALAVAADPDSCVVIRDDPNGPCRQTQDKDFSYPAWTLGLDYQLDEDTFLYAKTSGASMAGGWNIRGNFAPAFDPENIQDIELGIKKDFFESRLRLNAAIFHSWQEDVQRIINDFDTLTNTVTQYVTNAGDAKLKGAEFELTWLPWVGMEITGNLALLDGKYKRGTFIEQQMVNGTPVMVDRSREPLPHAPEVTYSVGATQVFPLAVGELSFHVDYSYVDERVLYTATAARELPQDYQDQVKISNKLGAIDSFGLLNAKIGLNLADTGLELSLWGRNIADKNYSTGMGNFYTSLGTVQTSTGFPRTYGVSLKYDF